MRRQMGPGTQRDGASVLRARGATRGDGRAWGWPVGPRGGALADSAVRGALGCGVRGAGRSGPQERESGLGWEVGFGLG